MTPDFQRDEHTGLWKWPVLLNDDWKKWAREPCAVLFGQSPPGGGILPVANLDLLARWPRLQEFCLGRMGNNYVALAQGYSVEQALLLAEDVNSQLREKKTPPRPYEVAVEPELTWGIAVDCAANWNLPNALTEVFSHVRRSTEEARFGSINIVEEGWQNNAHDELFVCAQRDGLTGLWNWHSLAALQMQRNNEPGALLMGDVDRFGDLNDIYGHLPGDTFLQHTSNVLHSLEQADADVAAFRLGGDEFVVWARGFSLERARDLAQEINNRICQTEVVPTYRDAFRGLSLTWGIVCVPTSNADLETMLRQADELVMAGKRARLGSVNS